MGWCVRLEATRKGRRGGDAAPRRSPRLSSYPPSSQPEPTHYKGEEGLQSEECAAEWIHPLRRMLARSPALPLVTTEASVSGFFTTCNSLDAAAVRLSTCKCGWRLNVQRSIQLGRSRDVSRKWRTLSADEAQQASVLDVDEESKQLLTSLNFSSEEAEKMLKKAFGCIHAQYWSGERKEEVPSAEVVTAVLNYIRSLGLSDEDLHKLLKKFPEVLGCDLDGEVKLNVSKLDSDWGINGKTESSPEESKSFGLQYRLQRGLHGPVHPVLG